MVEGDDGECLPFLSASCRNQMSSTAALSSVHLAAPAASDVRGSERELRLFWRPSGSPREWQMERCVVAGGKREMSESSIFSATLT